MEPPLTTLTLSMFLASNASAPKFKHKAAEGRYLLKIVRLMLLNFFPRASEHDMLRFNCLSKLWNVYQEMDSWNDDGSSTQTFRLNLQAHLLLYAELSRQSEDDSRWRLYPKHHLAIHIDGSTNPKVEWAYRMESEIGKACRVAAGCNVKHMHRQFIRRYADTA
jgi:hypothetical protein